MSELEKTAPNEIYLIVGDTDKDCNFNELAEVTWADKPIYEETAIKYVKSSQLTIPKSIADKLDDIFIGFVRERHSCNIWTLLYRAAEMDYEIGDELEVLLPDENQVNIAIAYLAGKALGVDLVKVVEG